MAKADDVYRWIRAAVAGGSLRPNDRVNADQISRELAVSKIPVREAIARLSSEGTLVVLPNAGAVVAPLSWQELDDIQQARLVLEPQAAALAAERTPKVAVAELRSIIAATRRWASDQQGDLFALNRQFHLTLVALSGNELLTEMLDLVLHRVSRYRALAGHTAASARSTAADHAAIVDALAAGDGGAVEALLVEHLRSHHNITAEARAVDPRYFAADPPGAGLHIC
jgi:DNA-binding GntR family transcriptional regulator